MTLLSWLFGQSGAATRRPNRSKSHRRATMELLEDRRQLSFAAPVTTSFYQPVAELAADVNGDNKADLVVLDSRNEVLVSMGKGNGRFTSPFAYPAEGGGTGPGFARALALADITGDGKPEIITAADPGDWITPERANVFVRINDGRGGFGSYWEFGGALDMLLPSFLAVGDFDGDHQSDIAVASNQGELEVILAPGPGLAPFTSHGSYLGTWSKFFPI